MDRTELETSIRRKLRPGPATDRVVAEILADADQYAAHMVEAWAHPPYRPPSPRPAGEREQAAGVTELTRTVTTFGKDMQ